MHRAAGTDRLLGSWPAPCGDGQGRMDLRRALRLWYRCDCSGATALRSPAVVIGRSKPRTGSIAAEATTHQQWNAVASLHAWGPVLDRRLGPATRDAARHGAGSVLGRVSLHIAGGAGQDAIQSRAPRRPDRARAEHRYLRGPDRARPGSNFKAAGVRATPRRGYWTGEEFSLPDRSFDAWSYRASA